ncbi:TlpA family protein disulfide reductase [Candidatus Berkelbacteria bacterium]|nr:TlpA family protein disulfide reductase [Candidatus Berkelbacteria bacterium]
MKIDQSKILYTVAALGVIFVLAVGWYTVARRQHIADQSSLKDNQAVSENIDRLATIPLTNYQGKQVSVRDFGGKPLVINVWASWCPFCKQELPDFATAQQEFNGRVVIVAIDRAEPLAVAKQYSDQLNITNAMPFLIDPADAFYQAIGGFAMPETLFIARDGTIVEHKRGPLALTEIRQKIQMIIK